MATLISLSGLPGVGKTTIASALSQRIGAVHLRVDSVEVALKNSVLKIHSVEDAGYLAIAAIAKDNLALGLNVIADTVNPLEVSRQLWTGTAAAVNASLMNVEIICKDKTEHKKRVEARVSDIPGLIVPTWKKIGTRQYDPWTQKRLTLDAGELSTEECVSRIIEELSQKD